MEHENYTLSVSKNSEDGTSTENHTYSATKPEDLKKILQLAGIVSATEEPVEEPVEEPSCGCHDGEDEFEGPEQAPMTFDMPDTPYDYETDFQPTYQMDDWKTRAYEQFTRSNTNEWPEIFENLAEDLMSKGLTREEANDKVLEAMSLDLTENWDYGHRDMPEYQVHQPKRGTLDKSAYRHFKQHYVQANYGNNPLEFETVTEDEDIHSKYEKFLKEADLKKKIK